jgi:hypothetical protein
MSSHCGLSSFPASQLAKEAGDFLLVGLHTDEDVEARRGPHTPIMNVHERALSVLACKYVDEVRGLCNCVGRQCILYVGNVTPEWGSCGIGLEGPCRWEGFPSLFAWGEPLVALQEHTLCFCSCKSQLSSRLLPCIGVFCVCPGHCWCAVSHPQCCHVCVNVRTG